MNVKPKRKATCHPDRPHYAEEKCKTCYQTSWERSSRERPARPPRVSTTYPQLMRHRGWGSLT
jgi:hypothetical protein